MSAAVDAAAQWTPRTPLEALASVSICDEEDERLRVRQLDGRAVDARREERQGAAGARKRVLRGRCCGRGGAEARGDAGPVGIGRYVDVGPRVIASMAASVGSHSLHQADAIIHDATIGVGCVVGKGAGSLGPKQCSKITASSRPARSCPSVLAPFSIVAGAPCRLLGEVCSRSGGTSGGASRSWARARRRRGGTIVPMMC